MLQCLRCICVLTTAAQLQKRPIVLHHCCSTPETTDRPPPPGAQNFVTPLPLGLWCCLHRSPHLRVATAVGALMVEQRTTVCVAAPGRPSHCSHLPLHCPHVFAVVYAAASCCTSPSIVPPPTVNLVPVRIGPYCRPKSTPGGYCVGISARVRCSMHAVHRTLTHLCSSPATSVAPYLCVCV
uniref:Uncharacterized protein n=1 Tax=Lygus hesperus TaxID=30085 RepID=A0A146KNW3_LYGHE